jgi:hypothetical protein
VELVRKLTTAITTTLWLHKIKEFLFTISDGYHSQISNGRSNHKRNRRYRILCAETNFHPLFGVTVTLVLGLLGDSVAVCPLPPAYSMTFSEQDITDINSKKEMYRLIYKKRQNAEGFYFEIVK